MTKRAEKARKAALSRGLRRWGGARNAAGPRDRGRPSFFRCSQHVSARGGPPAWVAWPRRLVREGCARLRPRGRPSWRRGRARALPWLPLSCPGRRARRRGGSSSPRSRVGMRCALDFARARPGRSGVLLGLLAGPPAEGRGGTGDRPRHGIPTEDRRDEIGMVPRPHAPAWGCSVLDAPASFLVSSPACRPKAEEGRGTVQDMASRRRTVGTR